MNHLEKKIHLLHDQRKKLDDRLNTLLQERNKTILKILEKLPTASLDNATLIGGIMDVCERASHDKNQAEVWRQAGTKFCKARQQPKASPARNLATKAA